MITDTKFFSSYLRLAYQGSYPPNTTDKPLYEKKCKFRVNNLSLKYNPFSIEGPSDWLLFPPLLSAVNPEEAPSGFVARGHYSALSRFVDDDDTTHLKFEWAFDIAKDW